MLLGNSIQSGFNQKFSAARLLQKLYQFAAQKGYGDTYLQTPPFFTLPGFEDIFTELATLGGTNTLFYPFHPTALPAPLFLTKLSMTVYLNETTTETLT